jgi:pyrimidine operon attenuation protein/uracil phosphoribosyltransferase
MPAMTTQKNTILDSIQIDQKIKRIAYQIYENNSDEKEVILAGIAENGYIFANKIGECLTEISSIKVTMCEVIINKKNPLLPISTSITPATYQNKSLVLIDDVLNSGATLIYGIKHFLEVPLKRFKTAVLVNRNHKKYPVKADFKGISLSTTLQEHVAVDFSNNSATAYLV